MKKCLDPKLKIGCLLIYQYDRFSRELYGGLRVIDQLESAGVRIIAVDQDVPDNAMGRFARNMSLVMAQFDNEQKSERVIDNMQTKFEDGFWLWQPPLGYRKKYGISEEDRDIPVIIDERYKETIFDLFMRAGTGSYDKKTLAYILNTIYGYEEIHGSKANSKTIDTILQNTFYYGEMYSPTWNLKVKGKHDAYVTKLQWVKAHQGVYGASHSKTKQTQDLYPLKKMMLCVGCMKVVTAYPSKGS